MSADICGETISPASRGYGLTGVCKVLLGFCCEPLLRRGEVFQRGLPALSPALRLFCRGSRSGLVWKLLYPTSLRGNSVQSVNSKLGHNQEKTTLNEPGLWTSCTRCRGGEESRYRTLQMHRHIDLSHRVEVKSLRLRSSNIKIVAELLFINWKVFSLGYTLAQDGGVLILCWMMD